MKNEHETTRGAPPKRGTYAASAHLHIRLDMERKNHYTRFAKKRRSGDKTLAGLVIDALDKATGYGKDENASDQRTGRAEDK